MTYRLSIAVALVCLASSARADFRADYETVKGSADDIVPSVTHFELAGARLRMDTSRVSVLVDGSSNGSVIVLTHARRQYLDLQKVADTRSASKARAEAALANLPPEQRAMVQQRMGAAAAGAAAKFDVSYAPTGGSDRVGGLACQIFALQINGRHAADSCLADLADTTISPADRTALRQAFERIEAMSSRMSGGGFRSPISAMPAGKFPVQTTHFDDSGNVTHVSRLKALSTARVDAGDFAIPAGYTEQAFGGPAH